MNTLEKFKSRLSKAMPSTDGGSVEDDLKTSVLNRLEDGKKVTAESIDEAINAAVAAISETSSHTKEQIAEGASKLRKELEEVRAATVEAGESAIEKVTPPRPKTRFLVLASAAMGVGSFLLGKLSSRPRTLRKVKSGETAGPGLFVCHNCDTRLQLASETSMPKCSNCNHETFSQIR